MAPSQVADDRAGLARRRGSGCPKTPESRWAPGVPVASRGRSPRRPASAPGQMQVTRADGERTLRQRSTWLRASRSANPQLDATFRPFERGSRCSRTPGIRRSESPPTQWPTRIWGRHTIARRAGGRTRAGIAACGSGDGNRHGSACCPGRGTMSRDRAATRTRSEVSTHVCVTKAGKTARPSRRFAASTGPTEPLEPLAMRSSLACNGFSPGGRSVLARIAEGPKALGDAAAVNQAALKWPWPVPS